MFQKRDQFGLQILSSELCKLSSFSNTSVQSIAQLWREGTITNFELVFVAELNRFYIFLYKLMLFKLQGEFYSELLELNL